MFTQRCISFHISIGRIIRIQPKSKKCCSSHFCVIVFSENKSFIFFFICLFVSYWECVIRGFDCFAVQKKQSMFHFSFKLMLTRVGGVLLRGSGNLIKKSNSSVQTINKSLITAKNSQPLNQFKFMSESANKKQKLMSTRTVISSPDAPKAIGPYRFARN